MGGVYNGRNLGLYSYTHQNPLIFSDPDGNEPGPGMLYQPAPATPAWQWDSNKFFEYGIRRVVGGAGDYIFPLKEAYVKHYRDDIKAAANAADIPVFALAAVAFSEYGGDLDIKDDVGYAVRSMGIMGDPRATSFGDLSIQIRNAAPILGQPATKEGDQKTIDAVRDPKQAFGIVAKFLGQIKQAHYPNVPTANLNQDQISVMLNQYNGPAAKTYGRDAYRHAEEINRALNDD